MAVDALKNKENPAENEESKGNSECKNSQEKTEVGSYVNRSTAELNSELESLVRECSQVNEQNRQFILEQKKEGREREQKVAEQALE